MGRPQIRLQSVAFTFCGPEQMTAQCQRRHRCRRRSRARKSIQMTYYCSMTEIVIYVYTPVVVLVGYFWRATRLT